jgi:hypothetical protein
MQTKRFVVGEMLREKRYTSGRYQKHMPTVFDTGLRGRQMNAVASFGSFARGVTLHDAALARDMADELNGVSYIPAVLRGTP